MFHVLAAPPSTDQENGIFVGWIVQKVAEFGSEIVDVLAIFC